MEHSGKNRKLNIIDVIVIVLLVAALAFAAYKLINRGGAEDTAAAPSALSEPNIRFTVLCKDLDPALAGNVIASLSSAPIDVDGYKVEPTRVYNNNELLDAQFVAFEEMEGEEGKSDLLLTIEANATETTGTYALLWQEIRIGKEYIAKTLDVELTGVILSLEKLG